MTQFQKNINYNSSVAPLSKSSPSSPSSSAPGSSASSSGDSSGSPPSPLLLLLLLLLPPPLAVAAAAATAAEAAADADSASAPTVKALLPPPPPPLLTGLPRGGVGGGGVGVGVATPAFEVHATEPIAFASVQWRIKNLFHRRSYEMIAKTKEVCVRNENKSFVNKKIAISNVLRCGGVKERWTLRVVITLEADYAFRPWVLLE